ncbi:hypothetical protein [Kutzneria kofuensis]|uniref:Uncharacterized protein n=1 Tax=Kutzneria kofuensis TaxID=103725 RepID=A0A7W9NLR8_9PSEU|nr:hypothetical protein [Kutzneria kofuensis]MBB5896588.1 hypothetical protein [Kutzneria kofuensis]
MKMLADHLIDKRLLRSGDIAVAGSGSYANLRAQLMTWAECQPLAADFCAQAME